MNGLIWLVVFSYSIHAAMPFNPIKLPFAEKIQIRMFITQGWKFFTRNPREEDIKVFVNEGDSRWVSALVGPNASPSNFFGIKRDSRTQGIEIGLISTSIRNDQWSDCKEKLADCFTNATFAGNISNPTAKPTLCGEVILVRQQPVPWAWSRSRKEVVMPSKLVAVNVLCSLGVCRNKA